MSGEFPALGFDPAPGDVGRVEAFVETLGAAATGLSDARTMLDGTNEDDWSGEAATAFRASMDDDFRPRLVDTGDALQGSYEALSRWASSLSSFQQRARDLEARAAEALASANAADQEHDEAQSAPDGDDQATQDAADRADAARQELDGIRAQARTLKSDVDDEAIATAGDLESAAEVLDKHHGNWFGDLVSDVGSAIADGFDWFMEYVVPVLEDILRAVAPIIAILAIFIPVLGPIALGISIALVAIDGLQALTGRGSWGDFITGAAGLAIGFGAGALARSAFGSGGSIVQLNLPSMGPALAGGGAAAGSVVTVATLSFNSANIAANTYWAFTTAKGAVDDSQGFADSLSGPWTNLSERMHNLTSGDGPRTNEELSS